MGVTRRYAIFVHDPDGDSGYGRIVGPFRSVDAADDKAESIRALAERRGLYVECIVLPVESGSVAARDVVEAVVDPEEVS